jgi:hypothetical protein
MLLSFSLSDPPIMRLTTRDLPNRVAKCKGWSGLCAAVGVKIMGAYTPGPGQLCDNDDPEANENGCRLTKVKNLAV